MNVSSITIIIAQVFHISSLIPIKSTIWLNCFIKSACPVHFKAKRTLLRRSTRDPVFSTPQGAFTPDANDANRANDLHVKSMQRRDRQSCGAIHANRANDLHVKSMQRRDRQSCGAIHANRANDLHVKSMQRRERQSCGAIRANEAARIELNCSEFRANGANFSSEWRE